MHHVSTATMATLFGGFHLQHGNTPRFAVAGVGQLEDDPSVSDADLSDLRGSASNEPGYIPDTPEVPWPSDNQPHGGGGDILSELGPTTPETDPRYMPNKPATPHQVAPPVPPRAPGVPTPRPAPTAASGKSKTMLYVLAAGAAYAAYKYL